ncbi:MAG TPA: type II toxin-antitoxin system VapC family toxin [Gemmataceae bacterium]|nr:type II toxin-antitoxin system VapC family toxin [Gemmataceae bacterium]
MAEHFYDTSAAVKNYRAELGTARVDGLLADAASRHYLSTLGVVEAHSVFARLVRMGQIAAVEFHRLRGRLLADIASGLWQIVQVIPADFQQAQQLLVQHATTRSLRTLDVLQLAVALSLHAGSPLDDFVCADANLCFIAAAESLQDR